MVRTAVLYSGGHNPVRTYTDVHLPWVRASEDAWNNPPRLDSAVDIDEVENTNADDASAPGRPAGLKQLKEANFRL